MVWNNSTALLAFITFVATSSIDFGVLICIIRSLDPFADDPSSCTILFPISNSNGDPFVDYGLLGGTCGSTGLNSSKTNCVATFSVYNLVTYRPSYVYCFTTTNVVVNVENVLDL